MTNMGFMAAALHEAWMAVGMAYGRGQEVADVREQGVAVQVLAAARTYHLLCSQPCLWTCMTGLHHSILVHVGWCVSKGACITVSYRMWGGV